MLDLALLDQLLDRAGHVLHRHVRVDAMLVEADRCDRSAAASERPRPPRGCAPAGCPGPFARIAVLEAELGGDHHLVAERRKRLAEQFLIGERAIGFRRVEEGDATFEGGADELMAACFSVAGP